MCEERRKKGERGGGVGVGQDEIEGERRERVEGIGEERDGRKGKRN